MPTTTPKSFQAVLIATYHNEHFRKIYHRMLKGREAERGIRTKMRVKLAAKMLVIAWTLMKKNEVFDPSYLSSWHNDLDKSAFNPGKICVISGGTIRALSSLSCPVKQRQALLGSNLSRDSRMWGALNNAPGEAAAAASHSTFIIQGFPPMP